MMDVQPSKYQHSHYDGTIPDHSLGSKFATPDEVRVYITSTSSTPYKNNEYSNKKRPRGEEEIKMDRREANRYSARKSREKKKKLQEDLESSVAFLTKVHADLLKENESLKDVLSSTIQLKQEEPKPQEILPLEALLRLQQAQASRSNLEAEIILMKLQEIKANYLGTMHLMYA